MPPDGTEVVEKEEPEDAVEEKVDQLATKVAALETRSTEQLQSLQSNIEELHIVLRRMEEAVAKTK